MKRRALPLLLAAAVLTLASVLLTREPERAPRPDRAGTGPDYFITGVVASETGLDGRLTQRLEADRLTHYAHDDSALIDRPHLAVHEAPAPWHAYAARGRMTEGGQRLFLEGDVRINRELNGSQEILTETLQIYPEQRFAETDAPITYRGDNRTVEAVGMELSLADERLVLKSQVRGTYAP
jgi:lipopolysaccharide export system protein LptC